MNRPFLTLTLLVLTIFPLNTFAQKSQKRLNYIQQYKDIAIDKMRSHGIPASITLAQGCLESGDGLSELAVNANNHFGIKCHKEWNGPTFYKVDDDPGESCFRKYKRAEESYKDHSDFLRYRDRYAFLFDLEVTDYKGWAHGLKKAGYATNPQYAQLLIKIIEDYALYQYDQEALSKGRREDVLPPSPAQLEAIKKLKPTKRSYWYKYSKNRTLYVRNGVTYILSNDGDTYASIAKEYNLFKGEILSFNDLKGDTPLRPGTIVYIEKKKRKAMKHLEIHVVEGDESLYDISQRYGVRLGSLIKYNKLRSPNDISPDDQIYLRRNKY